LPDNSSGDFLYFLTLSLKPMNPIFLLGTLALLAFLYWAAYQSARALKTRQIEITGNLLLNVPEFFFKLVLLGLCLGLANTLDVRRLDRVIGWPSEQPVTDLVIGVVIGIVLVFAINFASVFAIRIWGKRIYSPDIVRSLVPRNLYEWILMLIPLLLAVAVEEVLFRALVIGGFSLIVNPWAMALASSVLFGLMHSPQGILGIIITGVIGFIFGAIFIISGSLLMVIVTHFVVNILQILRAKEDLAWYERLEDRPLIQRNRKQALEEEEEAAPQPVAAEQD
jgi:uncharacterized protein